MDAYLDGVANLLMNAAYAVQQVLCTHDCRVRRGVSKDLGWTQITRPFAVGEESQHVWPMT